MVGMNHPTGYNLRDEVSNRSTDLPPMSYQILRGVHQLDGKSKRGSSMHDKKAHAVKASRLDGVKDTECEQATISIGWW